MMIDKFAGLRNDIPADRFEAGDLQEATNVDIDDSYKLTRRSGAEIRHTGICHSLWSDDGICLFVQAGSLTLLNPDFTVSVLLTGLSDSRMHYLRIDDRVYFSNGEITGIYEQGAVRSWGLRVPGQFPASDANGNMAAGRYQYALTFVRGDGQESGSSATQVVDVMNGGIQFTGLPVSDDAGVTHKILYHTSADGEQLYEALILDNLTTDVLVVDECSAIPLDTEYREPAPAGVNLAYYYGHVLLSSGALIYPSGPFEYELFRPLDFIQVEDRVTMLAPTSEGVFVGTDSTIGIISGRAHDDFQYRQLADYGVVPGSLQMTEAHRLGFEGVSETEVALFTTHQGICAGFPGGTLHNLTGNRYRFQASDHAASIIKQAGGSYHYLTSI